jgi:S-DNA-T family DNA segregation ATPase FtsK/SpoIIIE
VVAYYGRHYLGDGAYPLLLFLSMASALRLSRGRIGHPVERVLGLVLVVACTSASSYLISPMGSGSLPAGHGGLVGFALGEVMRQHLDRLGTLIIMASSFFVGLVFATQGWVLKLPSYLLRAGRVSGGVVATARSLISAIPATVGVPSPGVTSAERGALFDGVHPRVSGASARGKDERKLMDRASTAERAVAGDESAAVASPNAADNPLSKRTGGGVTADRLTGRGSASAASPEKIAAPIKAATAPIVNFPSREKLEATEPYPRQIENWRLPSLDLLDEPHFQVGTQRETTVRRQAQILEQTLEEFRLDARVVEIDTGPVITMFELKLGAGVKVSQIATLSNDIARALKAHAIRVVAPISGKNTVGIEVPNLDKERVRLRELIMSTGARAGEIELPLFLGKDAGGAALVTDLTKMPHLLIAGTTGSGKSVCLNTVILSLLMTKRPDHVKLILIDPKMVELSQFKEVPHLMCPIVTDMQRAEKILEWAVTQMDERYELLAEARVRNIAGYNALSAEEIYERLAPADEQEKSLIPTHIPYIVIVIDELADLMMTSAKEVEHHLSRLAQKSRAVGVHIIVATQRPEARVVTGLIKSNLPSRICFRVASRMDSRIVLDQNGGEVLLGQGDMLFLPPGSHKLTRAQGTYLTDTEIHAVLDDLCARATPQFHPELTKIKTAESEGDLGLRDSMFDDAVRIILESGRGSVSLLQRRLNVGYSRASRLIDQMAEAGIVGTYKGSQAREVLMSLEEWDALRRQVDDEVASGSFVADAAE